MSRQSRGRETIKGSWSEAEDHELRCLVNENIDAPNWAQISQVMSGRTAKQCRERWVQNLRPDLDHSPITNEEGVFIMRHVNLIGKKWAEIARRLENTGISVRSDNAVKNWYNGQRNRHLRAARRRDAAAAAAAVAASVCSSQAVPSRASRASEPVMQRELPRPVSSAHTDYTPQTSPAMSHTDYTRRPSSYGYSTQYQHQYSDRQLPPIVNAPAPYSDRQHDRREHERYADLSWASRPQAPPALELPYNHQDRRTSIYSIMDSPSSEATERSSVPSLASDAGSPALQDFTHSPMSPHAVPPMNYARGFAEPEVRPLSPSNMVRSWSGRSDQFRQQLPALEPKLSSPASMHDSFQPVIDNALARLRMASLLN